MAYLSSPEQSSYESVDEGPDSTSDIVSEIIGKMRTSDMFAKMTLNQASFRQYRQIDLFEACRWSTVALNYKCRDDRVGRPASVSPSTRYCIS
jgi:hypothetical protein